MARPLNALGELGERVAVALTDDGGERAQAVEQARQRFLAPRPSRPRRAPLVLGLAATLAAASLALWLVRRPGVLELEVNGHTATSPSWLAAPATEPLAVRFSDGTQFELAAGARARVVESRRDGADISLEGGSLQARVVHTGRANWRVIAGPFVVRVTGTRFTTSWNPTERAFSLAVSEGSVVVSGALLERAQSLRAGEHLAAKLTEHGLTLQDAALPALPARSAAATVANAPVSVPEETAGHIKPSSDDASDARWRELAKRGDLRGAFKIVEARGFAGVCESASAAELLTLGDAARLSGRADRATESLLTLRRRYPKDPRRAAAAFALGKVAFDLRRDYSAAADWFAKSMREQPQGGLAREAAGRRIEALRQGGNAALAEQAAREYLAEYPDGPHAKLARTVLK